MQHSDDDTTALIALASLALDHVRLFGHGEEGVTPVLAPKKSTDWDTTINALGFTIYSHTIRILFPREKVDAIMRLLRAQWPMGRRQAKVREILGMTGKLWNLMYVVRAGGYFVWRLLRLTRPPALLVFCVEVHENFRGSFHRFHGSFHSFHESFHRFHGSVHGSRGNFHEIFL